VAFLKPELETKLFSHVQAECAFKNVSHQAIEGYE